MNNKPSENQNNNSFDKYLIIFALIMFAGIIIFNAVNSPLIGGSNIIYVNNSAPSIAVENVDNIDDAGKADDYAENTSKQDEPTAMPTQDEYSYQSSTASTDSPASKNESISQASSDQHSSSPDNTPAIANHSNSASDLPEPAAEDSSGKININTATANQLMKIPGIGEVLADRIIQYRQVNGNFKSVDELINVFGIGEKILNNIRDYVTV